MTVSNWFEALGKPVPDEGYIAAHELLVLEGQDAVEAAIVLNVVCREIRHDEPDRAIKTLRSFLPAIGSETLLFRTLATLCTVPPLTRQQREEYATTRAAEIRERNTRRSTEGGSDR